MDPGRADDMGERLLHVGEEQVVDEEEELVRARPAPRAAAPEPHLLGVHGRRRGKERVGGGAGIPPQAPRVLGAGVLGRLGGRRRRELPPDQAGGEVEEERRGREEGQAAENTRGDEPDAVVGGKRRQCVTIHAPVVGHAGSWTTENQERGEEPGSLLSGREPGDRRDARPSTST